MGVVEQCEVSGTPLIFKLAGLISSLLAALPLFYRGPFILDPNSVLSKMTDSKVLETIAGPFKQMVAYFKTDKKESNPVVDKLEAEMKMLLLHAEMMREVEKTMLSCTGSAQAMPMGSGEDNEGCKESRSEEILKKMKSIKEKSCGDDDIGAKDLTVAQKAALVLAVASVMVEWILFGIRISRMSHFPTSWEQYCCWSRNLVHSSNMKQAMIFFYLDIVAAQNLQYPPEGKIGVSHNVHLNMSAFHFQPQHVSRPYKRLCRCIWVPFFLLFLPTIVTHIIPASLVYLFILFGIIRFVCTWANGDPFWIVGDFKDHVETRTQTKGEKKSTDEDAEPLEPMLSPDEDQTQLQLQEETPEMDVDATWSLVAPFMYGDEVPEGDRKKWITLARMAKNQTIVNGFIKPFSWAVLNLLSVEFMGALWLTGDWSAGPKEVRSSFLEALNITQIQNQTELHIDKAAGFMTQFT